MRLSISLLLVTLALCSYQANALVCPALVKDLKIYLWDPKFIVEAFLSSYGPPKEYVDAKMEVKKCVDEIPPEQKAAIMDTLAKVLLACGASDLNKLLHWP